MLTMPPFMSAVPRPMILPLRALGGELGSVLDRDDVEVAVEVNQFFPGADGAAHDPRVFDRSGRLDFDDLRTQTEPLHLLAQHCGALGKAAPRRILSLAGDQPGEQLSHLICAFVHPGLHLAGGVCHSVLLLCTRWRQCGVTDVSLCAGAIAKRPEDGSNSCPIRCPMWKT